MGWRMADTAAQQDAPAFSRVETLIGITVIGVLGLLLGVFALLRPAQVDEEQSRDYSHTGRFSYVAEPQGNSPYGPEGLSAGEPILTDLLGPVTTRFRYEFESHAAHEITGSVSFVAEVMLPQGLSREFLIEEVQAFTGPQTTVSGILPVRAIRNYVETAQANFADAGFTSATVAVRPIVRVEGTLEGKALKSRFAPELVLTLDDSTLAVTEEADVASPTEVASNPLRPTKEGAVEYDTTVTNIVPLLVAEPTVPVARGVGFGLAAVCLLSGLWVARPLLRSGDRTNEKERIRTLYGGHIVEVSELSLRGGPVASVATMEALVDVAKKYESKVMHVSRADGDSYSVWDNGLLYEYRTPATDDPESPDSGRHMGKGNVVDRSRLSVNGKAKSYSAQS